MTRRLDASAVACLAVMLAGCETLNPTPRVDVVRPTSAMPEPAAPGASVNGAIFQAAAHRPLFEDHRARLVGDTLTVQITEKVTATQTSKSSIDRQGTLDASITALPGLSANSFGRAGAAGTSTNNFSGAGTTANSNDFSGTITATVVQVLPNGHLVVAGEKQIGVSRHVDVLRFSGRIDPRAILPGNQVPSTAIADVRIEHRGIGAQAEAQKVGWLSRFFLNLLPI